MEFKAASVRHTVKHLMHMMDDSDCVHYVRFGDNELGIMGKIVKRQRRHKNSPEMRKELIEALKIKDARFVKAIICGYPYEPGMTKRLFMVNCEPGLRKDQATRYSYNMKIVRRYVDDDRFFYNPIAFHFIALYDVHLFQHFMDSYIRDKKKMFIGSFEQSAMELFYGKIDYHIKVPDEQCYYVIDQWWPKVLEGIDDCQALILSAGAASAVISKRLWHLGKKIHCMDFGSINNIIAKRLERFSRKFWARRQDPDKVRMMLLDCSANDRIYPDYFWDMQ